MCFDGENQLIKDHVHDRHGLTVSGKRTEITPRCIPPADVRHDVFAVAVAVAAILTDDAAAIEGWVTVLHGSAISLPRAKEIKIGLHMMLRAGMKGGGKNY